MRSLKLVPADFQRGVEYAQDSHVSIIMDEVGYAIVAIENDPYVAIGFKKSPAKFRETRQKLNTLLNAFYGACGCCWII